jgi:predicted Zn-dependent peptidase
VAALALAAVVPAWAAAGAADTAGFTAPDVRRTVLENGLTVLIAPRHEAPVFSAVIAFRVGSIDEAAGATGMAHMFEHMAFKGTRRIGTRDPAAEARLLSEMDDLVAEREALLARGGDETRAAALAERIRDLRAKADALVEPNAFTNLYVRNGAVGVNAATSTELTVYYVSLPANRLPLWAAMEYGRIADPVLREFYTERDVVMEERRMRVSANPSGRLGEAFLATGFLAHPYRNPPLGWASDVVHLTRPEAERFHAEHYVPANMVIALVGDLDPDQALALVRRTFGRLPARPAPPRVPTVEPEPTGERHVIEYGDAEPVLLVGFLRPPGDDPDDPAIEIIHDVLASSRAARLHRDLVLDRGLAVSVDTTDAPGLTAKSLFIVSARPRHPHTSAELEDAILEELARLTTDPVTDTERLRAVNAVESTLIHTAENNAGLAQMLARYEALMRDWRYPFTLPERMAALSGEDVRAAAARLFIPEHRIVGELRRATPPAAPAAHTAQ